MTMTTKQQIVIFQLDEELFAVEISAVERVLRYHRPRRIPDAPEWVEGVFDYQGTQIIPLVGLRQRFGLPAIEPRPETRILVLSVGREFIGVVVDAVTEVVTALSSQVAPPPPYFRGIAAEYLKGIVRHQNRLIVFLDAARLLTAEDRIELQAMLQPAPADV